MLDSKIQKAAAKRLARSNYRKTQGGVRESIVVDYANDMHPKDIATKHGVTLTTVYKWIARAVKGK